MCRTGGREGRPYLINKLNNLGLSKEELKNLRYQERCSLLNSNPVLVAGHFQYKLEILFKEIVLNGPLDKTKYYALRIEFQGKGSPYIHSYILIFNAQNIQDEPVNIAFIENSLNTRLLEPENKPDLPF